MHLGSQQPGLTEIIDEGIYVGVYKKKNMCAILLEAQRFLSV